MNKDQKITINGHTITLIELVKTVVSLSDYDNYKELKETPGAFEDLVDEICINLELNK